jgi:hypothetical protein
LPGGSPGAIRGEGRRGKKAARLRAFPPFFAVRRPLFTRQKIIPIPVLLLRLRSLDVIK